MKPELPVLIAAITQVSQLIELVWKADFITVEGSCCVPFHIWKSPVTVIASVQIPYRSGVTSEALTQNWAIVYL